MLAFLCKNLDYKPQSINQSFTIYIDNLIIQLWKHIGCIIGNSFLGVFGYADDLTLLCPWLAGLKQMLNVCEDYAKEYNILFNVSKSKLVHFGKTCFDGQLVLHMTNGRKIDYVKQCVHLETTLYSDISIRNSNNAVNDLFMRTNNLMADFLNAHSSTLSVLYNSYCMNVYSSQLWCFNDYKISRTFLYRMAKNNRRIWRNLS